MAAPSRFGFFALIFLFLRRMPSVWIGGFAATIVILIALSELGSRAAAAGAVLVVIATIAAEFWIDRRRGIGRRILFRGSTVSTRRVAAFVITMGLIAAATTAIASNFVSTMTKTANDQVRGQSSPNQKRGFY